MAALRTLSRSSAAAQRGDGQSSAFTTNATSMAGSIIHLPLPSQGGKPPPHLERRSSIEDLFIQLGGHGGEDYGLGWQLLRQVAAVGVAIAWSAVGSAACFWLVKLVVPLRHARDAEREGLDISDHGERAYNF